MVKVVEYPHLLRGCGHVVCDVVFDDGASDVLCAFDADCVRQFHPHLYTRAHALTIQQVRSGNHKYANHIHG